MARWLGQCGLKSWADPVTSLGGGSAPSHATLVSSVSVSVNRDWGAYSPATRWCSPKGQSRQLHPHVRDPRKDHQRRIAVIWCHDMARVAHPTADQTRSWSPPIFCAHRRQRRVHLRLPTSRQLFGIDPWLPPRSVLPRNNAVYDRRARGDRDRRFRRLDFTECFAGHVEGITSSTS